eukprot:1687295-Rhodomonas_salina.1
MSGTDIERVCANRRRSRRPSSTLASFARPRYLAALAVACDAWHDSRSRRPGPDLGCVAARRTECPRSTSSPPRPPPSSTSAATRTRMLLALRCRSVHDATNCSANCQSLANADMRM